MNPERAAEFPLSSRLVMLNHASFGVPTNDVLERAARVRAELEEDSLGLVDVAALVPRLRTVANAAARQLDLAEDSIALTPNATSGASAIMRSLRVEPGEQVVVLATEYASILRGWQVRCEERDATLVPVPVTLPVTSVEQLIDSLESTVRGRISVAQLSLVSSSTSIAFPVDQLTAWFKDRGATVVLDVAHGPGHVAVRPSEWGVDAMFGTLHKWFPTPRAVGLLWLADEFIDTVRPAEVSLTWDSPDLVERFSWPGTYDPTPRLCLDVALRQWQTWKAAGDLPACARLANYASDRLREVGAAPTTSEEFLPPRMRAFMVDNVSRDDLRTALDAAGMRVFSGVGPSGETMLRVSTHVYNDESDVERLCDVIRKLS